MYIDCRQMSRIPGEEENKTTNNPPIHPCITNLLPSVPPLKKEMMKNPSNTVGMYFA
jgi:hypothetical protein